MHDDIYDKETGAVIDARADADRTDSVLFEVTPGHVALFRRTNLYPGFCVDDCTGRLEICPAISWKRPFGNSGGLYDACGILGYVREDGTVRPEHEKLAMLAMAGLPVAVQCFAVSGQVAAGTYRTDRFGAWLHYRNVSMAVFWREAIDNCAKMGLDAARAAEFAVNAPARGGNPYSLLSDMREYFRGSEGDRRILKEFEDEAVRRYDAVYDLHGHDREAIIQSLIACTAKLSWPGWPFGQ